MKIHIFELQKKQWISEWSQLKQLCKLSLKKIQVWMGFEPMTYQLSYQANWELVIQWVLYIPT